MTPPSAGGPEGVPSSITVHLAPPDAPGTDLTLPLDAYLRTAACTGLRPAWPAEALRAHVLSLLSFTRHRLETGWYRRRGYPFDITADPVRDQPFQPHHTLYTNICALVEEQLYSHLCRPGAQTPFFAPVSTETAAEGRLSPWTAVALAHNGVPAEDILHRAYGALTVVQAPPPTPLRPGDTGAAVRSLQQQLSALARFRPLPAPAPTGRYTAATCRAVRAYQQLFRLPATGEADALTRRHLRRRFDALRQAFCPGDGDPPGEPLRQLQRRLNVLRRILRQPPVGVTGRPDPPTRAALRAAQRFLRLPPDGYPDAAVWHALHAINENLSIFNGNTG